MAFTQLDQPLPVGQKPFPINDLEIHDSAEKIRDPQERATFIKQACAGDADHSSRRADARRRQRPRRRAAPCRQVGRPRSRVRPIFRPTRRSIDWRGEVRACDQRREHGTSCLPAPCCPFASPIPVLLALPLFPERHGVPSSQSCVPPRRASIESVGLSSRGLSTRQSRRCAVLREAADRRAR